MGFRIFSAWLYNDKSRVPEPPRGIVSTFLPPCCCLSFYRSHLATNEG